MIGCLTLPFRVAAYLLILAALVAGWWYRDAIVRFGRHQLGMAASPSPIGHPGPGHLRAGRAQIEALEATQADSVVLSAAEVASLVAAHLRRVAPDVADSLVVEVRDREILLRSALPTAPLPVTIRDLLGAALREREEIEVGGPLGLRRAAVGELEIRRVRVRGLPVPLDLVGRLLAPYLPVASGSVVLFDVPAAVSGIRVTPAGVVLYGGGGR